MIHYTHTLKATKNARQKSKEKTNRAHGVFSARKRYGSRQKKVKVELESPGMMYRKELVSKAGTRLSGPISVTHWGKKSRSILAYTSRWLGMVVVYHFLSSVLFC